MNKSICKIIIYVCVYCLFIETGCTEPITSLQHKFQTLPAESQRLTGPLFWLHGDESKEQLEFYVEKVAEGGNGCFTAESRPHNDWLGEGWYRDLGICLEAAKKNDLKMWIFDEKWWPSGEVGGAVPQKYASKYMQSDHVDLEGGKTCSISVSTEKIIAVLAGRISSDMIDGDTLIDLTGKIRDGKLNWVVPQGSWRVMIFTWKYSDGRFGRYLVDGASQEAVDWYIQTVYQPHYDHFKDDFGSWIPGFFYDEPETHGDWGTEVIPILKERNVDWKKALASWKFTLAGEQQVSARYQYQDAFAEAWGRTLFGGITKWCHDHNVLSIGHFLEHGRTYLSTQACAGNMFQLQKYSDMGGIDAVFSQFVMGRRAAQNGPCWQTPKLGSSISHVYGKKDDISMIEIFGARGQDLSYPEMKWWTDHMHVSGINFHIPHSFNPRSPYDTDCPPYFYNGGKEPRWPLYRVYADYTSRLSMMLSGGRHVCPVAILFPGISIHTGKAVTPDQISEVMQDALFDCDWMPYEVFEQEVQIDDREMKLYQEQYRVLVVPPVEVIPYATLKKANEFFQSGGIVVGYDFLPEKASDIKRSSVDIARLREALWGDSKPGLIVCRSNSAGGRSYFLPAEPTPEQIQQVLGDDADIHPTLEVMEGKTDNWLHVLHRNKDGRDIFFICNQNIDGGRRLFRFSITAKGIPECWDPMRNEITSVPFIRHGKKVELSLKLDPLESMLLVFNETKRKLPELLEVTDVKPKKVINVIPMKSELNTTVPDVDSSPLLDGCSWIWQAGVNAAVSVAPGDYYFRGKFDVSSGQYLSKACFIGTADNVMTLFVNGREIAGEPGVFDNWKSLAEVDITSAIVKGVNTIAIKVINTTNDNSPAGLIGKFELTFGDGSKRAVYLDQSWKATDKYMQGWEKNDFNDARWESAALTTSYGSGPWGTLGNSLTLSPVKNAIPFMGEVTLSGGIMQKKQRYILSMENITPELAARITVNGKYAGGCIGQPIFKDITGYLSSGKNTICVEPFSPGKVEVLQYSY